MFCSNGKPRKSWTRKYNLFKSHDLDNKELLLFFVDEIKYLSHEDLKYVHNYHFLLNKVFFACYKIIIMKELGDYNKSVEFTKRYGNSDVLYCLDYLKKNHRDIRDRISLNINHTVFYNFMINLLEFLNEIKYISSESDWSELFTNLDVKNDLVWERYVKNETEVLSTIQSSNLPDIPNTLEDLIRRYNQLVNTKGGKYLKKRSKKSRRRRCKKSRRV
jgi:hypothetical protein